MDVDNSHSGSEGEESADVQRKDDSMECDGYSSGTNDVALPDCIDGQPTPRRIRQAYTLAFKLSVVDAYRNNGECRGNQRATARKFHIHRRQVQRWLRDERTLSLKFKSRLAAAHMAEIADASCEELGSNIDQHHTSSDATTASATEQNSGYLPRKTAGQKRNIVDMVPAADDSTFGDGPIKEDGLIDLSAPRRLDALDEPTTSNREQALKMTVLAAYHGAHKWHGTTAAVAQKFGIMVCDLIRWLKEERESSYAVSLATFLNNRAELSCNTIPSDSSSTDSDACSTVQRGKVQQYTPKMYSENSEVSAGTAMDFLRRLNKHLDDFLAAESLKNLWHINQLSFTDRNATIGPFERSIVPHDPSAYNSVLPQAVLQNAQLAVRPVSPLSEDQN